MKKLAIIAACGLLVLTACSRPPETALDTPTTGTITVAADNTLFPLVDALEDIFEHTYRYANLKFKYVPEIQGFNLLLQDSARAIVAARPLNELEKAYFAKIKITPRVTPIATDAIAFMVHPANPDTTLDCQDILKVLRGEVTDWRSISPNNNSGKITLVFDQGNSSTVTYTLDRIKSKQLPANAYALQSNTAVVEYVANHPNAIGIIGYSWVSDYDDPLTKRLRRTAKLVAVSPCQDAQPGQYFKPYANNIIDQVYPFTRNVYIISREARSGLALGFSSFAAGDVGQRIIKKAGIPPYYKVEYNIELRSESFKIED